MRMLTKQQEKFAQAYVLYRNATEAAKAAGYSPRSAHNQGHRLINNDLVVQRIENLERDGTVNVNVQEELEEQYTIAKSNNHANSALKALELLAKVKKNEEEVKPKSVEELESEIVKSLEILGEDRSLKILMKCDWFAKMLNDGVEADQEQEQEQDQQQQDQHEERKTEDGKEEEEEEKQEEQREPAAAESSGTGEEEQDQKEKEVIST